VIDTIRPYKEVFPMKRVLIIFVALLALGVTASLAATKSFSFDCRTKIIRHGRPVYEIRPYTYDFRVEVISDDEGRKREGSKWNRPFIEAYPEERYSVKIWNPMPIRVGVNLSIDGLNTVTGKPGGPAEGRKWIIEPYSFIKIKGWQVSSRDLRRFYFTSKQASYASWRSNSWGRDLSVNCGVIGAAFFFSKSEMEYYYERNPIYEGGRDYRNEEEGAPGVMSKSTGAPAPAAAAKPQAGTGMGERESNPVDRVQFNYDTGMYRATQAVIIYYDFPERRRQPQPFDDGYAPQPSR
jgi:hypothetical protein